MSDLYYETSDTGPADSGTSLEPAHDAPAPQQETAETDNYSEYRETEAETEARIADQDELPDPAESRAATWGDNPEYYDETELAAEYHGDSDAFPAEDDDLPTPQESRTQTWGDNPGYHDETDLASEYDADPGEAPAGEGDDTAAHVLENPDAEDNPAEPAASQEPTTDDPVQNAESPADDQPDPDGTDLETAEPDPETPAPAPDRDADNSQPEQPQPADAEQALPPDQRRISSLEAENADAKQQISDLRAENNALAARLDRVEQLLAGPDRQSEAASADDHADSRPEPSADQIETQDAADNKHGAAIAERQDTPQERDTDDAGQHSWRRVATAENVGIASAAVTAADTLAQVAPHATPEGVVGLAAAALGLASLGLAKLEKKRKGKS